MAATTISIIGMFLFVLTLQSVSFADQPSYTSRNQDSTPPNSILPISPAISSPEVARMSVNRAAAILWSKAALLSLGYDPGRFDGQITAKYRAALFHYQEAHNLATSGDLDESTYANLWGAMK